MSVRQAQLEISSPEFTEWMAHSEIEPFGEQAADIRHGIACSLLANVNRDSKARPKPYEWSDFVPWADASRGNDQEPVELDDPEAQSALIKAAIFGVKPKQ